MVWMLWLKQHEISIPEIPMVEMQANRKADIQHTLPFEGSASGGQRRKGTLESLVELSLSRARTIAALAYDPPHFIYVLL
jgi:hypothetical protein